MNRKINLIDNIVLLVLTLAGILAVTLIGNGEYSEDLGFFVLYCVIGAIVWALINVCVHEWGHVLAAKRNNFRVISVRLLFFLFTKENGKRKIALTRYTGEAGATELVPESGENLAERFVKVTKAGIYGNIIFCAVTVIPLFLASFLPFWVYSLWAIGLPVSLYFALENGLPMTTDGIKNDAAVVQGVKSGADSEKVLLALLQIHAELVKGKTPGEIGEGLYFDVPQLPEDDINYLFLLNARYAYYLDREDYENAKGVSARMKGLLDSVPKFYRPAIRADLLYNACTFDFDESAADNLVEDNESYLNQSTDVTVLRIKAAYLLYVCKNTAEAQRFLGRAEESLADCTVEGQRRMEEKLLKKMEADADAALPPAGAEEKDAE